MKVEVERLDIYDFKVVLTETEFDDVKCIAKIRNDSVEQVIRWFIEYGICYLVNDYK